MRRTGIFGAALALCGAVAFAGSASAFGGGHIGGLGGMGGMHMGGMGGMHMGGAGGGMHMGGVGAATAPHVNSFAAAPAIQSGRSVAVAPAPGTAAAGQMRGMGTHHGWYRGRYYGYGYGGFGYGYDDGFLLGDGYGYPYDYGYDYGYNDPGYGYDNGVQTGRSAAEPGDTCRTPVKSCRLARESTVGDACSCRVSGGRSPGRVAP